VGGGHEEKLLTCRGRGSKIENQATLASGHSRKFLQEMRPVARGEGNDVAEGDRGVEGAFPERKVLSRSLNPVDASQSRLALRPTPRREKRGARKVDVDDFGTRPPTQDWSEAPGSRPEFEREPSRARHLRVKKPLSQDSMKFAPRFSGVPLPFLAHLTVERPPNLTTSSGRWLDCQTAHPSEPDQSCLAVAPQLHLVNEARTICKRGPAARLPAAIVDWNRDVDSFTHCFVVSVPNRRFNTGAPERNPALRFL
jgi:hypothetical protein